MLKTTQVAIASIAYMGNYNGEEKMAITFQLPELITEGEWRGMRKIHTINISTNSNEWDEIKAITGATDHVSMLGKQIILVLKENTLVGFSEPMEELFTTLSRQPLSKWVCEQAVKIITKNMTPHPECTSISHKWKRLK